MAEVARERDAPRPPAQLAGKGRCHAAFDAAVADMPVTMGDRRIPNVPHTAWRLVEHLRLAQADTLAFSIDARHRATVAPRLLADRRRAARDRTVAPFHSDRLAMIELISPSQLAPLPHG